MDSKVDISKIMDIFDKCMNTIITNMNDSEERIEYAKVIEKSVHELAGMDIKHKLLQQAIEESKEECNENNEINIKEVFKQKANDIKHENHKQSIEDHTFVKQFKEKYANFEKSVFESTVSNEIASTPMLDPITKNPIVNPVRNKNCGHLYEQDSIKKMLESDRKKRMRCPYIGCAHRRYFTYDDLEENVTMSEQAVEQFEISIT